MAVLSGSHATGIRSVSGVVEPTRYRNQRTARIGRKCAAGASGRSRRRISARGLANIRAAQKARWAKARGMQKTMSVAKPGKRTISVAARRKIAPSQRTRLGKNQSCEQVIICCLIHNASPKSAGIILPPPRHLIKLMSRAHRDAVSGFCSSPRNFWPSNSKSTSRSLDRLVLRTGEFRPSIVTALAPSTKT